MTIWSVPVFLTVVLTDLPGAGGIGVMTLDAEVSGVPGYKLQMTDSSVFVYTNINVDTRAIGSVSTANVFLANAVINSSPDDTTSQSVRAEHGPYGAGAPGSHGHRDQVCICPR